MREIHLLYKMTSNNYNVSDTMSSISVTIHCVEKSIALHNTFPRQVKYEKVYSTLYENPAQNTKNFDAIPQNIILNEMVNSFHLKSRANALTYFLTIM